MLGWNLGLTIPAATVQRQQTTLVRISRTIVSSHKPSQRVFTLSAHSCTLHPLIFLCYCCLSFSRASYFILPNLVIFTSKVYPNYTILMAPVLSRSLASASLASLPPSSFTLKHSKKALNLRSTFIPYNRLRHGLSGGGLKWQIETKQNRTFVRCDTAVADKEAADASGEKFEYQAEVGFCRINGFLLLLFFDYGISVKLSGKGKL